jgi:DNA-binding CsgD family transcriptional regulator/predicted transcriptional regulator
MRGIDADAQAVYRLMLTDHNLGVEQIARSLALSEDDVEAALEQLSALRLLRRSEEVPGEGPGGLRPVDPRVGLATLLQHNESVLQQSKQDFERKQEAISRMLTEFSNSLPREKSYRIERLIGVATVQARLEELTRTCATECLALHPGGAQSVPSLEASRPLDREVLGRGVTMRAIYLDSIRKDRATAGYAEWLAEQGAEVRTVPVLPVRMLVYDRQTALVPIDPDRTRLGAVQVTGTGVLTALAALFDRVWADGAPIGASREQDDSGLTPQERELLRLLGQGLTDETAGKSLGLSLRTVRRMMADLMERLGAHSRFEAGLTAGRRGWL